MVRIQIGILSKLADFLNTDNSHLEQTNKENKELIDLEENENNKDIFEIHNRK